MRRAYIGILVFNALHFILFVDARRVLRQCVGDECKVMVDANQKWGVHQAIAWMKELAQFNIHWIEEPTSPDDVLGHKVISQHLAPLGDR